jgi:7,8-dihydropterin-6-yl-methyl-4-(beta-D-ribofuranosyl)aminobenzene 5'-phosphate synthase
MNSSMRGLGLLIVILLGLAGLCLAHQIPSILPGPLPTGTSDLLQPSSMPTATTTQGVVKAPASALPSPVSTTTLPVQAYKPVAVTIVYDNRALFSSLRSGWGFACLVEVDGTVVLFDTGDSGVALMSNLRTLGVDPGKIDIVVLSHIHGDHIGGLDALLESNDQVVVYVPISFPASYKESVQRRAQVVEVSGWGKITEQIYTTGEMGDSIPEQGLVVISGCAHPGIVAMTARASDFGKVRLVMGGFHLFSKNRNEIQLIVSQLHDLGVETVAPCHCTGDLAIHIFEETYGPDVVRAGAGLKLMFQP